MNYYLSTEKDLTHSEFKWYKKNKKFPIPGQYLIYTENKDKASVFGDKSLWQEFTELALSAYVYYQNGQDYLVSKSSAPLENIS